MKQSFRFIVATGFLMLAPLFVFAYGPANQGSEERPSVSSTSSKQNQTAELGSCSERAAAIKKYILKERPMWDLAMGRMDEWKQRCLEKQNTASADPELATTARALKSDLVKVYSQAPADQKARLQNAIQAINRSYPPKTASLEDSSGTTGQP